MKFGQKQLSPQQFPSTTDGTLRPRTHAATKSGNRKRQWLMRGAILAATMPIGVAPSVLQPVLKAAHADVYHAVEPGPGSTLLIPLRSMTYHAPAVRRAQSEGTGTRIAARTVSAGDSDGLPTVQVVPPGEQPVYQSITESTAPTSRTRGRGPSVLS